MLLLLQVQIKGRGKDDAVGRSAGNEKMRECVERPRDPRVDSCGEYLLSGVQHKGDTR